MKIEDVPFINRFYAKLRASVAASRPAAPEGGGDAHWNPADEILSLANAAGNTWVEYDLGNIGGGGGGGAPTTAKYLLQQPDGSLPNAQAMGALGTGIVKNTTTTGVQSIATAGTDYTSPSGSENLTNKTIDSSPIGGTTPAAGKFTTLENTGAYVHNEAGAAVDWRAEGDTDPNLLFLDAGLDSVGIGTNAPDSSAKLQIDSTTKGFAAPRMTTAQRDAIGSPMEGLQIYNTTTHQYEQRTNSGWSAMGGGAAVYNKWDVFAPPSSPHAKDDEFNDNSFNTTLWDDFNFPSNTLVYTENAHGLLFYTSNATVVNNVIGFYQAAPASGDFTVDAYVALPLFNDLARLRFGIGFFEDATSSTDPIRTLALTSNSAAETVELLSFTAYNGTMTQETTRTAPHNHAFLRLALEDDGGGTYNYHAYVSWDGENFLWLWSMGTMPRPAHIGMAYSADFDSSDIFARVRFFRVRSGALGSTDAINGRSVGQG